MVNDVTTELFYSGVWNDITTDVRQLDPIKIRWGRANESGKVQPSRCTLTLNNADGTYSPRNPTSPLFGLIGRNTPIRVRLGDSDGSLRLPGSDESYADTPDVAALDITGDIDIRIEVDPATWRPDVSVGLARKYLGTGDERSWAVWLEPDGKLAIRWSTDGTFSTTTTALSTVAVPGSSGRLALRWTIDVDNGATGNDVTFYTAPSIGGPWTQLGATVTNAGVTSVNASTANLEVGRITPAGIATDPFTGRIHAFQLRDGIDGTLVADLDFADHAGDLTFTDAAGLVWTLHGDAVILDPSIRFSGEVSSWPARWDVSGSDVSVPIEASGIRRRLGQGASPLRSSLFRQLSTADDVVAYWPCEDGEDATKIASAIDGHPAIPVVGDIDMSSFSKFVSSAPIPVLNAGKLQVSVPPYTVTGTTRFTFLVNTPVNGYPVGQSLSSILTSGTSAAWQIFNSSGGDLQLIIWERDANGDFVVLEFITLTDHNILGKNVLLSVRLVENGADVDWQVSSFEPGKATGIATGGTLTGRTVGRITKITHSNQFNSDPQATAIGHIHIRNAGVLDSADLDAHSGETAEERIVRLCAEENVALRIIGDGDSQLVGPQRIATFLDLLDDAAVADLGILGDDRDALRLVYRIGADLDAQDAALTLDYAAEEVAPSLEPVEDDQATRNDVTVKRPQGSSARAVLETGPLSVQSPPDGVGRYDTSETVNVASDQQLPHQAGWRLHLGTVDEARYPEVTVDLTAVPALTDSATAVQAGDRVQIVNPPDWLPPDIIDQLAQGGTEQLTPHRHLITYNATPASPWTVGHIASDDPADDGPDDPVRIDTAGSEVAELFLSGTDTQLTVATSEGPAWTEAADDFPMDLRTSGVVLRATAAETVRDTFTRTEVGQWGTSDAGLLWTNTTTGTAAPTFDVSSGVGTITHPDPDTETFNRISLDLATVDISGTVSVDAVATGDALVARLHATIDGTLRRGILQLNFNTGVLDGTLQAFLTNAWDTPAVGLDDATVGTYVAGEQFRVRLLVTPELIRGRVWPAADPEPVGWTVAADVAPNEGFDRLGVETLVPAGNTNVDPVFTFDDIQVNNAQVFTVDQAPVNGVAKTIPAESDVRLAQPAFIAL